jgi:xylulokinase
MLAEGYLGLDLGGTCAKAGVFDHSGKQLALVRHPYSTRIGKDGYPELRVEEVLRASRSAVTEAVTRSGARIMCLCVSSQGQTFITLDDQDRPLHEMIPWFDSRATGQAERIRRELQGGGCSGVDTSPIAASAKILWLRERYPDLMKRAARFLLLPDFVSYHLTGKAVFDPVIAATTGFYLMSESRYCEQALETVGVELHQLSQVAAPGVVVGDVLADRAAAWGLSPGIPVVTGTNDQLAGALGAGNCRPGIISETTGTCLALVCLAHPPLRELPAGLFHGPFPLPGTDYILAYSKTAGLLLEWFRVELNVAEELSELDHAAEGIPPGSDGLIVLPHFDGMVSPRPNVRARGAILNLTLRHSRYHLYRAMLESLAFSLMENLELLTAQGFHASELRSIGGGARSDLWLQIKADVSGIPIQRPVVTEAAVLGAAMLAAAGIGHYQSIREASEELFKVGRVFHPRSLENRQYRDVYRIYLDLQARVYT